MISQNRIISRLSPRAEAAQCAAEQGRFWEYHDALFARQSSTIGWNFISIAEDLDLHPTFSACLHEVRNRLEVLKDLQYEVKLGVTGTPIFFINGRPLLGARRLVDF